MPFGPRDLVDLDTDLSKLRKVPGLVGYYINEQGEVFTIRRLSQYRDKDGYARINSGKVRAAVHSLLAKTFLPKPQEGQNEVRHLDGNCKNNILGNLAWGTRAENAADMARHGTAKGSGNGNSKITEDNVVSIVALSEDNSAQGISELLGISLRTVKAVLSGQNWSHYSGIKKSKK